MSIVVNNVTKKYGSQIAVNQINFNIAKGEIVGFLGPNGAGKSTTMKMLTGYVEPEEGEILICNDTMSKNNQEAKAKIGYLPEHNPLYKNLYVKEYLQFVAKVHDVSKDRISEMIALTGLTDESTKKINQLSKGYQQRVGLAAALIHDPEILILDEPTTGLDPNQLIEVRALIKTLGVDKTVLFSTHIMQEVEAVCDRVIIINKGSLVIDESLEKLKSGQQQVIFVEFDFKIEQEFVNRIPDLSGCENYHDTQWELHFNTNDDKRGVIFDFANENGLKILKLDTQNKNLEQLFKEATKA